MNELAYYIDKYFIEKRDERHRSGGGYVQQPLLYKYPEKGGRKHPKSLVIITRK